MAGVIAYSLVIPVYKNEESLDELLKGLRDLGRSCDGQLEVVFVVDGSPDRSFQLLKECLPREPFPSQLVMLSRNFGSFAAIRVGLAAARGSCFAVMAADLQEPVELVREFFTVLSAGETDVVIGTRQSRQDPWLSRLTSKLFWSLYRRLIDGAMPPGGVDIFGCNAGFRERLLALKESNSTLVGLLFWLGFRRKIIGYERRARRHGKSAWTFGRRFQYFLDSMFAFSDLPIKMLTVAGLASFGFSAFFAVVVLLAKFAGAIPIPGYAATVLTILFFAGLNSLGLGVIGSYVWRTFENTKERPLAVVMEACRFDGRESA